MKKSRLQELAGLKKALNEGNAWDRNEDGSLPTIADTTARYAAANGIKSNGVEEETKRGSALREAGVESGVEGPDLVITLKVPLALFEEAAGEFGFRNPDLEQSQTMLKKLASVMEKDLKTWFNRNGNQWLEESISGKVYDEFFR